MEEDLNRNTIEQIIESKAAKYSVDPNLIRAIIETESAWDIFAHRYESQLDEFSIGLMQVLLSTARNILNDRGLTNQKLFNPEINIEAGVKYLGWLKSKYQKETDVISAYNAGRPLNQGGGNYGNQKYVDKVLRNKQIYDNTGVVASPLASVFTAVTGGPRAGTTPQILFVIAVSLAGIMFAFDVIKFRKEVKQGKWKRRR